jgi:uncharacterized protein (TIGR01244 family)
MKMHAFSAIVVSFLLLAPITAQVTREEVAGIRNLARLQTTVACAGATDTAAVPMVKKMGFVSIINLREADEPGADIPAAQAAAKTVGLRYFHVPFDGTAPSPEAATAFLNAITTPGAEPAFIHCAGGNRAATMWLIKRIAVDGWEVERATMEAAALGQTSATLRQFAIDFALKNKR